jgi:hypothetical protein
MVVGVTNRQLPQICSTLPVIVEIPVLETAPTPEKSTKLETVPNPERFVLLLWCCIQTYKTKEAIIFAKKRRN